MRTKILLFATAFALAAGMVSCLKTDDGPSAPVNGGDAVPDPEGTVLVSVRNKNNGDTSVTLPNVGSFRIDESDNFVPNYSSIEFCAVGPVNSLGNVRIAPESGWSQKVAVVKGYGYLVRHSNSDRPYDYARLYVTDYIENVAGGVMGAYVKYQSPFVPENIDQQLFETFKTRFPDSGFRTYLLANYDANGDKIIDEQEMLQVESVMASIYRPEYRWWPNFEGLKYLPNLKSLEISGPVGSSVSGVDVTHNPVIERISISLTNLSFLDLTRNQALNYIFLDSNNLVSLDVSQNKELTSLWCGNNQIETLDLTHNPKLTSLGCNSMPALKTVILIKGKEYEHLDIQPTATIEYR